jgi:hypothetical protein
LINALAESGFVVLGGPVGNDDKVILIVEADSEGAIRRRPDADPWTPIAATPNHCDRSVDNPPWGKLATLHLIFVMA